MKKILSFLAVAVLLSVSCDKEEKSVPLPEAVNKDYSLTVVLDDESSRISIPLPSGKMDHMRRIEFHPSSTGIAVFEDSGPVPFEYTVKPPTKAVAVPGTVYQIADVGTVSITSCVGKTIGMEAVVSNVKYVIHGSVVYNIPAEGMEGACRGWTVSESWISVTGDGVSSDLGIAKRFEGCDINVISKYVQSKGVDITVQPATYNVRKILLGENGKFAILFDGESPYYGDYELSTKSFSYRFTHYNDEDPIIGASANGKLSFLKNGKGRMEIFGIFTAKNGTKYNVSIVLFMNAE